MKEIMMWSDIANEWNAFVDLGEKENQDDRSNALGDNSSIGGVDVNLNSEQTTEVLNGRMDVKGRVHDIGGKYMVKAGLTSKPNWKAEVIQELTQIGESENNNNER